jgi:hypothetical protein
VQTLYSIGDVGSVAVFHLYDTDEVEGEKGFTHSRSRHAVVFRKFPVGWQLNEVRLRGGLHLAKQVLGDGDITSTRLPYVELV